MGSTVALLSAIVGGMSAYAANLAVQKAGLGALWRLAEHGTTYCGAQQCGARLEQPGACASCAGPLPCDDRVHAAWLPRRGYTWHVPVVMCAPDANQQRMGSTVGLLPAIVGGMSVHVEHVDVQRAGLEALQQLATHSTSQCGAKRRRVAHVPVPSIQRSAGACAECASCVQYRSMTL